MNERIRQLAEQAANEYLSEMEPVTDTLSTAKRDELAQKAKHAGIGIIPHGFSEKFAELIVKECMNQVREQYLPVLEDEFMMKDTHWDGYVQCGVDSYVAIKEHFGVEE